MPRAVHHSIPFTAHESRASLSKTPFRRAAAAAAAASRLPPPPGTQPSNVLIATSGHIKLADFGLSSTFMKQGLSFG